MKVTVTTLSDQLFTLDVSEDMELENLKALCECESGIPAREIVVMHEGRPLLDDKADLKAYGIKEGEVLLIQQFVNPPHRLPTPTDNLRQSSGGTPVPIDFGSIQIPGHLSDPAADPQTSLQRTDNSLVSSDDPAKIREMLLTNPEQLALLKHSNPRLADALLSGDLEKFTNTLKEQQQDRADRERLRIRMMNADPFDAEAQELIAEEIRQHNIDSNMEAAMEYHPESFGQVAMLYVNCKVNGHPVKAFIDSGAQTTIMSQTCAERCNIMRLVDPRWAGIAKGVGTQTIIGRVHLVQIQIGKDFLTSSFSILEEQPMDMLLGLDMLKRHQCCIDLRRNVLIIGTTGTETPFLSEGDLPDCARIQFPPTLVPDGNAQEHEDRQLAEALAKSVSEATVSSQQSAAAAAVTDLLPTDNFSEVEVQNLVKMGFPREQVITELRNFNGNCNQATAALFAKSLQLP